MDLVQRVLDQYNLPHDPFLYQRREVNRLANGCLEAAGYYWGMGAGKTLGTTLHHCIHRQETGSQTIQLCPPILIKQWARWLDKCGISNKIYAGGPEARRKIDFDRNTEYFIMSTGILKNDFLRIREEFSNRKLLVNNDEATSIKNPESGNYKAVKQLSNGQSLTLATGTPLSTPADAYAYVKLLSPEVYRSYTQFENIHVEERDFFKRPIKWKNLDRLAECLALRGSFISTAEVNPDMPRALIQDVQYDLAPSHKKLYKDLVEKQLLVYDNGATIDATTPQKMHQAIQQLIINYGYFAQNEGLTSESFKVLDEFIGELASKEKLVIFANYRMSVKTIVRYLIEKGHTPVVVNGDVTATEKDAAVEKFKDDPSCRFIVMNPESGGYGVDGLQHVCNRMIFMEVPTMPRSFWQGVARLERPGQKFVTDVRILTALGTIQVYLRRQLQNNNQLVQQVVPTVADLRAQLLGR